MGLAIVRAMLDAHGGTIVLADSAAGTAFELTIPVADRAKPRRVPIETRGERQVVEQAASNGPAAAVTSTS